jgi:endonuclease YncB( thermonuclease family)
VPEAPKIGVRTVLSVISADTVELEDTGPVRLLGVDARQAPSESGARPPDPAAARALLEALVANKSVLVECDPETADTEFKTEDGLLLVYLMTEDGVLVNTELVARGGAVADLSRPYRHKDELVLAERDARFAGRGLWETATATNRQALPPLPPSPGLPSVTLPARPGQSPVDAAKPTPRSGDVLVTSDGRYHRQSCSLAKGGVPLATEEAQQKRYLACPSCFVSSKVKT